MGEELRHLWGSVTRTMCGKDAFQVASDGHVLMTHGPILRVVHAHDDATCPKCLALASPSEPDLSADGEDGSHE